MLDIGTRDTMPQVLKCGARLDGAGEDLCGSRKAAADRVHASALSMKLNAALHGLGDVLHVMV
jgi:hypothetical protein